MEWCTREERFAGGYNEIEQKLTRTVQYLQWNRPKIRTDVFRAKEQLDRYNEIRHSRNLPEERIDSWAKAKRGKKIWQWQQLNLDSRPKRTVHSRANEKSIPMTVEREGKKNWTGWDNGMKRTCALAWAKKRLNSGDNETERIRLLLF
jgi:hypothetical protein